MTSKMTDYEQVVEIVEQQLNGAKISDIERMGGLTNRTYLVNTGDKKYVVRLPGAGTEKLINRHDEKISTELACDINIDTKLYYFDTDKGVKISQYIDDSETMHLADMQKEENIVLVANLFKKLHNSGVDTKVPFDVIDTAETYEKFIRDNSGKFYDDYDDVKAYINKIKNDYLPSVVKAPCHNDPLCENWVKQGSDKMYLVDWEYAGMNDPMWDVADISIEAEMDDKMDILLLETYFGRSVKAEEWKAFQINKVLIDYLWSLWGKTRAVFDGEEMEEYALGRWQRMDKNREKLEG